MSGGIVVLPVLQELEELLCSSLLEKAHQRGFDGFHLSGGDLGDSSIPVDEASGDLFEFEVSGDLCVDQDLCEFTRSDDELWYEIDVIIPVSAELGGYVLVRTEFAVELGEIGTTKSNGH